MKTQTEAVQVWDFMVSRLDAIRAVTPGTTTGDRCVSRFWQTTYGGATQCHVADQTASIAPARLDKERWMWCLRRVHRAVPSRFVGVWCSAGGFVSQTVV